MALEIPSGFPDWLVEMMFGPFPVGNEDALRIVGAGWDTAYKVLLGSVREQGLLEARAAAAVAGTAATQVGSLQRDVARSTADSAEFAAALRDQAYQGATDIEYTKLMIIGTAALLLAQLVVDAMLLWGGGVKAAADRATAEAAMRMAAREGVARMQAQAGAAAMRRGGLRLEAVAAGIGGASGAAVDYGAQKWQQRRGHRGEINARSVLASTVSGAVGGAAGAGVGMWLGPKFAARAGARIDTATAFGRFKAVTVATLPTMLLGGAGGAVGGVAATPVALLIQGGPVTAETLAAQMKLGIITGFVGGVFGTATHAVHQAHNLRTTVAAPADVRRGSVGEPLMPDLPERATSPRPEPVAPPDPAAASHRELRSWASGLGREHRLRMLAAVNAQADVQLPPVRRGELPVTREMVGTARMQSALLDAQARHLPEAAAPLPADISARARGLVARLPEAQHMATAARQVSEVVALTAPPAAANSVVEGLHQVSTRHRQVVEALHRVRDIAPRLESGDVTQGDRQVVAAAEAAVRSAGERHDGVFAAERAAHLDAYLAAHVVETGAPVVVDADPVAATSQRLDGESTVDRRREELGERIPPPASSEAEIAQAHTHRPAAAGLRTAPPRYGFSAPESFANAVKAAIASGERPDGIVELSVRESDELLTSPRVEKVTFRNDLTVVRKYVNDPDHAHSEYLSALVGAAIDAPVPAVHLDGDVVYMEVVRGETAFDRYRDTVQAAFGRLDKGPGTELQWRYANTAAGRSLGFFDHLTKAGDRHDGNFMVTNFGSELSGGFDNALSFHVLDDLRQEFGDEFAGPDSVFASRTNDLVAVFGREWLGGLDFPSVRDRLTALRPEFETMGHADWHDGVMQRFGEFEALTADPGRARLELDLARTKAQERLDGPEELSAAERDRAEQDHRDLTTAVRRADAEAAGRMHALATAEAARIAEHRLSGRRISVDAPGDPFAGTHAATDARCGPLTLQAVNDYYHAVRGGRVLDLPAVAIDGDGMPAPAVSLLAGGHLDYFGDGRAAHARVAARLLGAREGQQYHMVDEATRKANSGRSMLLVDTDPAATDATPGHSYFVVNHEGELLLFDFGGRFLGEFDPAEPHPRARYSHGIEFDSGGRPVHPLVIDYDTPLPAAPAERTPRPGAVGRLAPDGPETPLRALLGVPYSDADDAVLSARLAARLEGQYGGYRLGEIVGEYDLPGLDSPDSANGFTLKGTLFDDAAGVDIGMLSAQMFLDGEGRTAVYFEGIYFDADHRGTGAGVRLVRAVEDMLRANGIHRVELQAGDADGGLFWALMDYRWFEPRWAGDEPLVRAAIAEVRARSSRADRRLLDDMAARLSLPAAERATPRDIVRLRGDNGRLGREVMEGMSWSGVKVLNPREGENPFAFAAVDDGRRRGKKKTAESPDEDRVYGDPTAWHEPMVPVDPADTPDG
ncbi:MAG: GNAT family N-acetyltransferase [Mycobacteriaceae bacterium]|nr:GNAT family N-acetyltransferase [Mycobacteriaceae bacterium]